MKTFAFVVLFAVFALAMAAPAEEKKDLRASPSIGLGYGIGGLGYGLGLHGLYGGYGLGLHGLGLGYGFGIGRLGLGLGYGGIIG